MLQKIWKARSGYFFILPKLFFVAIFVIAPVIWSFFVSFQEFGIFDTKWVGLANFQNVLTSSLFWTAVSNTLRYAAVVMPATVLLALILASFINPLRRGAQSFFRASFYLPTVASSVVISMIWRWIFQTRSGLANYLLSLLGIDPINWLHSSAWALRSVIIMTVLTPPGVGIILYLAAMNSIPESLYEAAHIDGANRFVQWWKITLPLLRPTTLYLMIISTINSFQVFDQVMLMTQGGPGYATTTIVHQIYNTAFRNFEFGYAGAMSMLLFIAVITLALIQSKFVSSDVEFKG